MTSEVLIMTPSAVAMAADSVVTVNGNKTYEGVNKLFMLSNNPPMGIMTYNNANFLTFPMETIIKDFRDKIFKKEFDTIHDFKKVFGEYLNDVCHGKDAITSYSIVDKFNSFIKQLNQDLDEIPNFIKHIMEETTNIDNEKYEKLLFENKEFERIYDSKIQEVSENIICDDDVDLVVLFKKLFIKRFVLDGFIGIVIAGFNRENLFPSYMHFKIIVLDGVKFIFDDCEEDCVGGETAVAELWNAVIQNAGEGQVKVSKINTISQKIDTATDMFYDISALNGRTVVISNTGADRSILSITDMKVSYKPIVLNAVTPS